MFEIYGFLVFVLKGFILYVLDGVSEFVYFMSFDVDCKKYRLGKIVNYVD